MSTPATLTLSASDIAKLADVGRSTVSNWRNRYPDFPQPVAGDTTSPRFAKTEVEQWLEDHGKKVKDISLGRHLWSAMNGIRGAIEAEEAGAVAADLIVWRYVSDRESDGFDDALPAETQWSQLVGSGMSRDMAELIRKGMWAYEESHPEPAPLFNAIHSSSPGYDQARDQELLLSLALPVVDHLGLEQLEEAFESFQDQITRSVRRGYDSAATSDTLVNLVATLASSIPGPVHDPAVGSGRMLMATARHGENRTALTGQDIDPRAVIQANQRALLAEHARVDLRHGDVFAVNHFDQALAQVVVMDPPYGVRGHNTEHLYLDPRLPYGTPPKSSMDLAWLQLATWYLGTGGRAFVLQPAGSAFRGGAEAKIRAAMLQAGTIEAIIALPAGLASHTRIPLNLWVLARPGEVSDADRVLMIDHSETKDIDPDALTTALQDWRENRTVPTALPAEAVSIADILTVADKTDVNPRRWLSSGMDAPDLESVRSTVESLHRAAASTRKLTKLTAGSIAAGTQPPKLVSITDLEKAGSLEVLRTRETIRDADRGTDGTPIVSGAWIRGDAETRTVELGLFKTTPTITQPGDVLLQNTGGLAARVDAEGGRVLTSNSFHLLRPLSDNLRPEFLAEFIVSAHNRSQAQGAAIQRIRLQDLKVPLLPVEQQDSILERLTEVRTLQESATGILDAARQSRDALVDATSAGTISIG
ncbi:N-6 DNA methylase [Citricoccus parietis]|uniref:N-6 DNA methylase n=1 Tax=Citricoccus parietis TaxID=592307 RepID=A0ABV6F4J6_9MICC